jgi:hypothetical protein
VRQRRRSSDTFRTTIPTTLTSSRSSVPRSARHPNGGTLVTPWGRSTQLRLRMGRRVHWAGPKVPTRRPVRRPMLLLHTHATRSCSRVPGWLGPHHFPRPSVAGACAALLLIDPQGPSESGEWIDATCSDASVP